MRYIHTWRHWWWGRAFRCWTLGGSPSGTFGRSPLPPDHAFATPWGNSKNMSAWPVIRLWVCTCTWSMSHMTTLWTVLCLSTSLAAEPSPPPMMKTVFGLKRQRQRISARCWSVVNLICAKCWSIQSNTGVTTPANWNRFPKLKGARPRIATSAEIWCLIWTFEWWEIQKTKQELPDWQSLKRITTYLSEGVVVVVLHAYFGWKSRGGCIKDSW